jgi:GDP/UDP-N,N'-diacetylbacillosamine 2-epimerase (hydrolysing)
MNIMKVHVISTARAEYNHCLSIAMSLLKRGCDVTLIMTGSHSGSLAIDNSFDPPLPHIYVANDMVSSEFTVQSNALNRMSSGFSEYWSANKPDCVVCVGDRFELLAPVSIAVLLNLVIVHAYGGECDISYCIDTRVRNAVTCLSHLHFVAHDEMKKRLVSYGEEAWRVHSIGNVALSRINSADGSSFLKYARERGWGDGPFVAACYLPTTTVLGATEKEFNALLDAVLKFKNYTFIWAGVNADAGSGCIRKALLDLSTKERGHYFVEGLGTSLFYGLLQSSKCLVGNSSSGFLEAASFKLPVVNVGTRQVGRLSGGNVVNVAGDVDEIANALTLVLSDNIQFKRDNISNPFYVDDAADKMACIMCDLFREKKNDLLIKRYISGDPSKLGSLVRCKEFQWL